MQLHILCQIQGKIYFEWRNFMLWCFETCLPVNLNSNFVFFYMFTLVMKLNLRDSIFFVFFNVTHHLKCICDASRHAPSAAPLLHTRRLCCPPASTPSVKCSNHQNCLSFWLSSSREHDLSNKTEIIRYPIQCVHWIETCHLVPSANSPHRHKSLLLWFLWKMLHNLKDVMSIMRYFI